MEKALLFELEEYSGQEFFVIKKVTWDFSIRKKKTKMDLITIF